MMLTFLKEIHGAKLFVHAKWQKSQLPLILHWLHMAWQNSFESGITDLINGSHRKTTGQHA